MDIEKCYAIAFLQNVTFDVAHNTAYSSEAPDTHMSGNQRIRHTAESAGSQMHVGSAYFTELDLEQCGIGLERRDGKLTDFCSVARRGNDGGERGIHLRSTT
jgi:hypothetical protein